MKIIFQTLPEWFDYITLVALPILAIVASIFTTVYNVKTVNKNTNKQIANQNKETYRPRLRLKGFTNIDRSLEKPEYMFFSNEYNINNYKIICTKLELENIGYGIANEITFYSLNSGQPVCSGYGCEELINQRSFCTEEIVQKGTESYQFSFIFSDIENIKPDIPCIILCNYKDLSGNNYKLIITYIYKKSKESIIKNDCSFDEYYYQEGSTYYNNMVKIYSNQYNQICDLIDKECD